MILQEPTEEHLIWRCIKIDMKLRNYIIIAIFALLGSTGMYLYYLFVGCQTGTCLITSSPTVSTGYGLLLGGLIGSSINDFLNKSKQKS